MQDFPRFETAFHKQWNVCITIFSFLCKTINQTVSEQMSDAHLVVLSIG